MKEERHDSARRRREVEETLVSLFLCPGAGRVLSSPRRKEEAREAQRAVWWFRRGQQRRADEANESQRKGK